MKFTVLSNELRAAGYFASRDTMRYVLNGVNIEVKEGKAPIISATDGRRILTLQSQVKQEPADGGGSCNIVLSSKCLALIQKLFPGTPIQINPGEKQSVTISSPKIGLDVTDHGGLIEGSFPNFRMVLPRKSVKRTPIHSVGVNPIFLTNIDAVAKALKINSNEVHLQFTDENSIISIKFNACDYVYMGVMPMRLVSSPELWEPDFLELPASLAAPSESGVHA